MTIIYLVALPWLILQLTGSSIVLGTITMVAAIPRAALMLLGGAVTDRISPRKIMMLTASLRTVLVAAVSVLIWLHVLQLWQLYILALCFGIADAFAGPAVRAYLPFLVAPEQLAAANSVSQSTVQVTTLVAPGPAGLCIKAFGTAWAFFIDAVSFLFIIGALWRLPDPPSVATGAPRKMLHSILDGLHYVKNDVPLASLMLVVAVLNFAIVGPTSVGIAMIAKQRFGTPLAFGFTDVSASRRRLDATDSNLKPFGMRGGKLILWHGWNDPAISALSTIDYYKNVMNTNERNAESFVRLFMVPGMQHCGGGPGPTSFGQIGWRSGMGQDDSQHDMYMALEQWVEKGVAPERLIATKYEGEGAARRETMTRPLCAYPQTAKYKGSGEMSDAANFVCAVGAR
jgi:MFS family permease